MTVAIVTGLNVSAAYADCLSVSVAYHVGTRPSTKVGVAGLFTLTPFFRPSVSVRLFLQIEMNFKIYLPYETYRRAHIGLFWPCD